MHEWLVWPEEDFPRTSTHKPRRKVIEQAVAQRGKPASAGGLAELIGRVTGRTAGDQKASLESTLNLSSLDRVELMSAIEDRYQIDLSETSFAAVQTVGDLERLLRGEAEERAHYDYPRWALRWPITWIRFLAHYLLVRPAVFLLGWPRMEGRENLQGVKGPVLVIANHISHVDVGFVLTALPARFRHRLATAAGGEALQELRTPPSTRNLLARAYDRVAWALGVSLLNLFPLPRAAGFRASFAYAGECVDRGYSVLVFPEGRHTTDGNMNPFRAGIGLLANNLKIPIVPIRIDGLFERKQAGRHFAWPGQIRVKIGRPVSFPPGSDAEQIAHQLFQQVAQLAQ
jgi:long-chain acyl-CoA synthetase